MVTNRSVPALVAGLVLIAAYYLATRLALGLGRDAGPILMAILNFLTPGFAKHPIQALVAEAGKQAIAIAGLILVGIGVSRAALLARITQLPSLVSRGLWRPAVWYFLAGSFVSGLITSLSFRFIGTPSPSRGDSWLLQLISILGYTLPIAGLYCAVRLLFGRASWPTDKWLGYIGAGAALYSLSWQVIPMIGSTIGLGDYVPLLGLFLGGGGVTKSPISLCIQLATGCAAAWTGLTLARKSAAAMQGQRDYLAALYPLLAATILSGAVARLGFLDFFTSTLSAGHAISYVAVFIATTAMSLLCLIDGVLLAAPDSTAAPTHQPTPGKRTALISLVANAVSSGRFWADFGLSFFITIALLGIAYVTVGQIPLLAAAFMLPVIIFGFLVGPIVVFIIGALRGRPGFAIAPIIILLVVVGVRYTNLEIATHHAEETVEEAAGLNLYPFAEPTRKHDLVIIEDSYDNRADGRCSIICEQILLTSDYNVALPEQNSKEWRIYRRANDHDLCIQPAQIESYLSMLAQRRIDTCITLSREAPRRSGLVVRENQSSDAPVKELLPKGLRGSVYEFYERIDGTDRLLGRVVSAVIQAPLLSDRKPTTSDLKLTGAAFYAEALKLPIAKRLRPGDAGLNAVIASLEPLLTDGASADKARETFRLLGGRSDGEVEPKRAAILRLWQSDDPALVKLGLRSLYSIREFGLDFAKPAVAAALSSEDSDTMKAAVSSLYAFEKDLDFAKPGLAALVLAGRTASYGNDMKALGDVMAKVPGGYDPVSREQAKAQLATWPDLSDIQLVGLLGIVARGDEANRQEAVDWLFALKGESFERAVAAIAFHYDVLGEGMQVRFWSEAELRQLIARAPAVSDKSLIDYVTALQFQVNGRDLRPKLRDILKERADQIEGRSIEDQQLAKKMRDAASRIRS